MTDLYNDFYKEVFEEVFFALFVRYKMSYCPREACTPLCQIKAVVYIFGFFGNWQMCGLLYQLDKSNCHVPTFLRNDVAILTN